MSENPGSKQNIMEFGDEERADQLMQILNSYQIKEKVINKYNLLKHYDINPNSDYVMTKLYEEYENNITFRRTEYMSVEIKVLDTDPQLAADIANDIANLIDTISNKMQKERAIEAYKIMEEQYNSLLSFLKETEDSLTKIRMLGVNDYESQSEVFHEQLAISISKNNTKAINALEQKIKVLGEYGSAYVSLTNKQEEFIKQLNYVKSKYEEAKIDAEKSLPNKFIVDKAFKAEKKTYPVRWLIVLVSLISSLIIAVLSILSFERLKEIKPFLN